MKLDANARIKRPMSFPLRSILHALLQKAALNIGTSVSTYGHLKQMFHNFADKVISIQSVNTASLILLLSSCYTAH